MGKQRIPRDVTQAALYLVRGQPAREKRYREQKNQIAGYDKKTRRESRVGTAVVRREKTPDVRVGQQPGRADHAGHTTGGL